MGGVSLIEGLMDPLLVARVQEFFGVRVPDSGDPSTNRDSTSTGADVTTRVLRSTSRKMGGPPPLPVDEDYEFDQPGPAGPEKGGEGVANKRRNPQTVELQPGESPGSRTHSRTESSSSSSGVSSGSEESSEENLYLPKNSGQRNRVVGNYLWYYLFKFGTALGDEAFYAFWFSFWFWNIDGAVGRRVVLVWGILMYIGQGMKDIIRLPRPACPPVVRLERKWEMEYGFPSTHAVVGAAVPFATIIFTSSRYQYPLELGVVGACLWCTVVCVSRLYLGMHSVLDILAGLSLVAILFVPVIPLVDFLDPLIVQGEYGGLAIFLVGVFLCFCTPGGDRWSPARSDTFVILGSCVGLISGGWLNFQLGVIRGPPLDPPYSVIWPGLSMMGLSFLRLVIGLCMVIATRAFIKSVLYTFFHTLLKIPKRTDLNTATKLEVFAELAQKYLSYVVIALNITYLSPAVFRLTGIERPTFHTEI